MFTAALSCVYSFYYIITAALCVLTLSTSKAIIVLHRIIRNGTLAVDGWAVTFGTARRSLGGLRPRPVPSSLY